jgi:hypothetical protein
VALSLDMTLAKSAVSSLNQISCAVSDSTIQMARFTSAMSALALLFLWFVYLLLLSK